MKKLIVGMSGASGAIHGVRFLQVLKTVPGLETHLVLSPAAKRTLLLETDWSVRDVEKLADHVHAAVDIAAPIASGSFRCTAMIVAPCSIRTLSGIANSFSDNLLLRAADVMLKERRKLVLLLRETPLHVGHLRTMIQAAEMGAVIMPPVPAFYHRPASVAQIVDQTVNRALDMLDIALGEDLFPRWNGGSKSRRPA
jgi:4-hydroxy-3-polyprenylbenzoate decarboxylase